MTLWVGKHGKMLKNSVAVAQVSDFKIDVNGALFDGTGLGADWKVQAAGLNDWKGSCNLYFDPGITEHAALQSAIVASTGMTMLTDVTFQIDGSGSHKIYSGNIWIVGFSPAVSVGDLVKVAISFTGDGVLTFTA